MRIKIDFSNDVQGFISDTLCSPDDKLSIQKKDASQNNFCNASLLGLAERILPSK